MTWEDYVHLAFDEIRIAGAGSPQVARRLRAALEDLLTVAPQERKNCLHDQLSSRTHLLHHTRSGKSWLSGWKNSLPQTERERLAESIGAGRGYLACFTNESGSVGVRPGFGLLAIWQVSPNSEAFTASA